MCELFALLGNFACLLSSANFFQNQLLKKILSGIPSECQTVWIEIRPEFLSSLIWVETLCRGNQQMTLGDTELKAVYLKFGLKA